MFEYFNDKAVRSVMLAQEEARRLKQNLVGSEFLLLGVAAEGSSSAARVLEEVGITRKSLRAQLESLMGPSAGASPAEIPFTPKVKRIFERAFQESRQRAERAIAPEHLLAALLKETQDRGIAAKALENLGVRPQDLLGLLDERLGEEKIAATVGAGSAADRGTFRGQSSSGSLADFGMDLTDKAARDMLDPVIGREREIERAMQILGRRTKSNPILIGEPGVGKTAIAEGLAQRITAGDAPELLRDKRLFALDLTALVAGTRFRGEFEERLKGIVKEVREAGDIILFIDEIHTLIGGGSMEGSMDAANLLKPALARGELQCLGATTLEEYRKYIEKDPALERRFQPVRVGEPTVAETVEILHGLRAAYEAHHQVSFTDEALKAAAELSERYVSDRFLPDKAIDLIDEAGSRLHLRVSLARKQGQIEVVEPIVGREDIAEAVADWTGIPASKVTAVESEELLDLESHLHERVIGQDEAVNAVAKAVRRVRAGIGTPSRPIASFLFCGPTGVGKTELAKALASYLFGDEAAMVRLDMSELMEPQSVSKLIGAPPGFVGFEEGGQLTEMVRRRPYSVVLFDEIEKAHPDVFNLLLQLLEDGRLTDSRGRVVNFNNTLVIMTSNLGAKVIEKGGGGLGFELEGDTEGSRYNRIRDRVRDELKNTFRPEFINRLDETVVFRPLNRAETTAIAEILLRDVAERLKAQHEIELVASDRFKAKVVDEGYSSTYGARPLRRTIMRLLEDRLAEAILAGLVRPGQTVEIDLDDCGETLVMPKLQGLPQLQSVG